MKGLFRRMMERRERRRQVGEAIRNGNHRQTHGTFVAEAEFHRTEELRPDRLGPIEDDVDFHDPWRPTRTLGPIQWPGNN